MKLFFILVFSFIILLAVYFFQPGKTEWIMPKELNEISGIAFIDDHTLACVQDEKGIIFLYDLQNSEIAGKIPFAGKGDYEGIALADKTAYIITGDGILYEVADFRTDPKVTSYPMNLKAGEESEAVCFDRAGNRLLFALKSHKKYDVNPELFAFDLSEKKFLDSAVMKMNLQSLILRKKDRDNAKKKWEPADLTIDELHEKIYVIDAINGHLMEFSMDGDLQNLRPVDRKKIRHPEGIAISPDGGIFLCNDANNDGKGKIVKWKN